MAARYKIRLKNTAGVLQFETDDWRDLSYTNRVNGVGAGRVSLFRDSELVDYFATDRLLEIWRKDDGYDLDWYRDWVGVQRKPGVAIDQSGDRVFTADFLHINEFLARRVIAWYETSSQAEKADVGETVVKEYVTENLGAGATTGAGREAGGVMSGLAVEADAAAGGAWQGDRSFKGLLETVQEVCLATDLRFQIVDTGIAGGIQTFEFRVYDGLLGADRSTSGLDPSTGMNAAGNAPVIFDIYRENLSALSYGHDRTGEVTSALVLGQGEKDTRLILEVVNASAESASIWNHREAVFNANQESDLTSMGDVGDAALADHQAKLSLQFSPLETLGAIYGKDFDLGDLLTARVLGADFDVELLAVTMRVAQGSEEPSFEFGNLT